MMDTGDLAGRIRLGEDSTLDLKRVLMAGSKITDPKRNDFADELAGMANGWGGTIVLGVDDRSREVLGIPVERLDSVEGWVREICNDSVKPPLWSRAEIVVTAYEVGAFLCSTSMSETAPVLQILRQLPYCHWR